MFKIEQSKNHNLLFFLRINLAILLFIVQLYYYQYYYRAISNQLFDVLYQICKEPYFDNLFLILSINQPKNIIVFIDIILNSVILMVIIKLIYQRKECILLGLYTMLAGVILYTLTNFLCKITGIFEIGILSVDLLIILTSPLPCIFLIPAMKLIND